MKRDVAIYAPFGNAFYEDLSEGDEAGPKAGGRELQMMQLAIGLAAQGLSVAHIVYPMKRPRDLGPSGPDLVERGPYEGAGRLGPVIEAREIWRGMKRADAAAYIFRGGGPQMAVAAAFCALHRRKLVFSSAIDLDFDFDRPDRSRAHLIPYRAAIRRSDLIVVQSQKQLDLARAEDLEPVVMIPSFAEPAEPSRQDPEAFLWVGRLVRYKGPLEYVRLAEARPEARFRMVCAYLPESDDDVALWAELQEADRRLDNFELIEQLPRERVLELMDRSVALVSTSSSEGVPNVFLEAWSRGVPVLSLNYDPDGQITERGLGVATDGDLDALADAAGLLWSDRAERDGMGESGREFVRERHDPSMVAKRWAEVLSDLLPAR
jgi:glycosyltransferase involved in cell wall biosynthesis